MYDGFVPACRDSGSVPIDFGADPACFWATKDGLHVSFPHLCVIPKRKASVVGGIFLDLKGSVLVYMGLAKLASADI